MTMRLALAATLLALHAASLLAQRPDAYLDGAARETVRLARERREGEEGRIRRYQALAKSRVSLGLRAVGRERLFYRCDSAARIDWRRGEPARMELLGGREVIPIISTKVEVGDDCAVSPFDPTEDRLSFMAGGIMGGGDSVFIRHPLAPGSEAYYRFRSGDNTVVTLPGMAPLRLVELEVIPRRRDPHLVSGSLWLEGGSHAVVRATLRLAAPFDLEEHGDEDDIDDVPRVLRPIRADLRFLTIEYGLWEQRWWLPRLVALEGEVEFGRLARAPLRVEQLYSGYEVEGDISAVAPVAGPGEIPAPRQCRSPKEFRLQDRPDTTRFRVSTGCSCHMNRCRERVVLIPRDTTALLKNPHLPPSIFADGEALITEAEMRELIRVVKGSAPAPWQLVRPEVRWGPQDLELLRYNRVEGLSVGVRAEADLGRLTTDGTVRLGLADLAPNAEVGVGRTLPTARQRLALYRRLDTVVFSGRALGPGNSLSALLLGRDDADYFRTLGVEVVRTPATGPEGLSWRLFAERQSTARKHTDLSLRGLVGDATFPENVRADEADQVGARIGWRMARGLNPAGWRRSADLSLEGSAGTFRFARPALTLFGAAPLPGALVGSLEVAGGTSFGEVPVQSLWYLGGPTTVRGYGAGSRVAGEAFWRGRGEVGTALPGARVILFSDAGWAGAREELNLDPLLLSAGVGVSFLDGLVRMDLARALRAPTGWRLEMYLDAAL
jgi:hypothetical protein